MGGHFMGVCEEDAKNSRAETDTGAHSPRCTCVRVIGARLMLAPSMLCCGRLMLPRYCVCVCVWTCCCPLDHLIFRSFDLPSSRSLDLSASRPLDLSNTRPLVSRPLDLSASSFRAPVLVVGRKVALSLREPLLRSASWRTSSGRG